MLLIDNQKQKKISWKCFHPLLSSTFYALYITYSNEYFLYMYVYTIEQNFKNVIPFDSVILLLGNYSKKIIRVYKEICMLRSS